MALEGTFSNGGHCPTRGRRPVPYGLPDCVVPCLISARNRSSSRVLTLTGAGLAILRELLRGTVSRIRSARLRFGLFGQVARLLRSGALNRAGFPGMTRRTNPPFPREVRERAVRLVLEHQGEHTPLLWGDAAQLGAAGRTRPGAARRPDKR